LHLTLKMVISESQNANLMKKIALILILPLTLSLVAIAAQKKEGVNRASKIEGPAATEQHVIFTPADLKWMDGPPGLPPGAKMAVLSGDPAKKGLFTVRLQVQAGYKVPPHTHPSAEHVTVISGVLYVGAGDKFDEETGKQLEAGSYVVLPADMTHYAWSRGETIIQIHSMGPFEIKYVNPADDPRSATKQ
jgi:quercetin dioxygenase-like cupin family protein